MTKQIKDFIYKLKFLGYLSKEEIYCISSIHDSIGILPDNGIKITFFSLNRFNNFIKYTEDNKLVSNYQCITTDNNIIKKAFIPNSYIAIRVSIEGKQHGI